MDFFNKYHLGDSIYSLIYLNNLKLNNQDLEINYSSNISYFSELKIHSNINFTNNYKGIDLWIQANNFWGNFTKNKSVIFYDEFFHHFYNDLSQRYNLKTSFDNIEDTLYSNPLLKASEKSYDLLLINSRGLSAQYRYVYTDFIKFVNKLPHLNIITTEKISGYECTRDYNMNLLDIANLAINCKYIVGVHTAPYSTALNKESVKSVKKWIVLNDKNISYSSINCDLYDDIKKVDTNEFV